MKKIKSTKAKIATRLGVAVLAFAFLFFLLRGPYLSNFTKRLIIPTLENSTGERVIMNKAVINLLPFYLQGKGIKVFDKDGNQLLYIRKSRVYIGLTALLSREFRISKLTLLEPEIDISKQELNKIINNVKKYTNGKDRKKYRTTLKAIELTDGEFSYSDNDKSRSAAGKGLSFEMARGRSDLYSFSLEDLSVDLPGSRMKDISLDGRFRIRGSRAGIEVFNVTSSKSVLNAEGDVFFTPEGHVKDGTINCSAEIYAESLNELLGLETDRDGQISLSGLIKLSAGENKKRPLVTLDIDTSVHFYLETLMEIIRVKHDISGEVTANGKITGTFPDIKAAGKARLKEAIFARFPVDGVSGKISYENMTFSMSGFTGSSYGGTMKGDAHISIPHGNYTVIADVVGVNSPDFFRFIRWDPHFPAGKIKGNVRLDREHGHKISVIADLDYQNITGPGGNLLNRIETMHTDLELREDLLTLRDTVISSDETDVVLNGNIDLHNRTLGLGVRLDTDDIADLSAPYYERLNAPAVFTGRMEGELEDPVITGLLKAGRGSVHGIEFSHAAAVLEYRKELFSVKTMDIEHKHSSATASGSIEFREAKELFSFISPYYKGEAYLENAELLPFIKASYRDIPVTGLVSGKLWFSGDSEDFKSTGDLKLTEGLIYGQAVDSMQVRTTVLPGNIEFHDVNGAVDDSIFSAKGKLYFDGTYDLSASASNFDTCDINVIPEHLISANAALSLKGAGTIYNPDLDLTIDILDSYLENIKIGKGSIRGGLHNKKLQVEGTLVDGKLTASAEALLAETITWNAKIGIARGRYDFLLKGFLDEAPEDFALSLEGNIDVNAHGANMKIHSKFPFAELFLYGYRFINNKDIELELDDNLLTIRSFALTGDDADMFASGEIKLGQEYDVSLKGKMDTAPLRSITDKIESLKGRGIFAVDIMGRWEKPEYIGEITAENISVKLTDFQYQIGPVNGTLFLNRDRITFDSVTSSFAGGSVIVSGVGYLNKLSLDKVLVSSVLTNIKMRPMNKVSLVFDGNLFYEKTLGKTALTGNVDIKRARYKKNVELGNWLLGLKEISGTATDYMQFLGDTELNIHLTGSDDILIDNNIARTPVRIELNVMGNIKQKGLLGRVQASEGTIYFRSNEFEIMDGSTVEFVDPNSINPIFHILAETYIHDYYVKLALDGSMDRFSLSLFSDPPLSEVEILTLLTFGQVKGEAKGFESGLAASEAAYIVTGDIQEAVESKFKNIAGIERFEIEPHTTTTGAVSPRVTIGKRILEDKLSVIYSSSIGTTEENVIKLNYKINKKFSLVGSRDEIGSAGVDLKYKFEFK